MIPAQAAQIDEIKNEVKRTRRVLTPAKFAARSLPPIA